MESKLALAFPASKRTAQLQRATFATSRLLDFCSEKELAAQTGHDADDWPLVIAKELTDNALDACEEAGVAPVIEIKVDRTGITIADNGPGLPAKTVKAVLDFTVRVSSREAYVAPTRGAQGNALKTILAMPFVLSGGALGVVEIAAQGKRHRIDFAIDQLRQQPVIGHAVEPAERKNGTEVKVHWPDLACSILAGAGERFLQIADDYTWLNPHLSLTVDWFGETRIVAATDPAWTKWKPSDPTSPHWYTPERLGRLIAAYVTHDADRKRDRTVREFVSEFRGLSGSAKQQVVGIESRLPRATLADLIIDHRIDAKQCAALLQAMQNHSKPVKPAMLGIIGRDHLAARFKATGCQMESFSYRKIADHDDDGIPFLIEVAFGWLGDEAPDERRLVTGVNWSPGIINPFRQLGAYGQSLDSILSQQRVDREEPVIFVLHAACPRVDYLDRGKSSVAVRS
jgi:DNA topoisomerase VI subunit B